MNLKSTHGGFRCTDLNLGTRKQLGASSIAYKVCALSRWQTGPLHWRYSWSFAISHTYAGCSLYPWRRQGLADGNKSTLTTAKLSLPHSSRIHWFLKLPQYWSSPPSLTELLNPTDHLPGQRTVWDKDWACAVLWVPSNRLWLTFHPSQS